MLQIGYTFGLVVIVVKSVGVLSHPGHLAVSSFTTPRVSWLVFSVCVKRFYQIRLPSSPLIWSLFQTFYNISFITIVTCYAWPGLKSTSGLTTLYRTTCYIFYHQTPYISVYIFKLSLKHCQIVYSIVAAHFRLF